MFNTVDLFSAALDLENHPIRACREETRKAYCEALSYIVTQAAEPDENVAGSIPLHVLIEARLRSYRTCFALKDEPETDEKKILPTCLSRPWRKKHRLRLMCDAMLTLVDPEMSRRAAEVMKRHLSSSQGEDLDLFVAALFDGGTEDPQYSAAKYLAEQCLENQRFFKTPEYRVVVTANMSAGKSTLVNALVGKPLARTSQELCTSNICRVYNKPFEDGCVAASFPEVTLCADSEALMRQRPQWHGEIILSSRFHIMGGQQRRVCFVDTPGVDAALHCEHGNMTKSVLLKGDYEKVLYVLSPTNLGTDAEMSYLKWISDHVPKDKVIFVLNKIDEYRGKRDSIEESIEGLRADLVNLGFEDPTICPISAYFGILLKMRSSGQALSEDEEDEYTMLRGKFEREAHDLSRFYDDVQSDPSDSEEMRASKTSGLYGLEKILYGGIL